MSRRLIRTLKRTVMAGVKPHAEVSQADRARESALALLERSIAFGHERLALVRLSPAARTGADIPPSHWNYCRETAGRSRDARKEFATVIQQFPRTEAADKARSQMRSLGFNTPAKGRK